MQYEKLLDLKLSYLHINLIFLLSNPPLHDFLNYDDMPLNNAQLSPNPDDHFLLVVGVGRYQWEFVVN